MRRKLYLTLISSLMLMCGCITYSDNPLTDPLKEPLDRSICGTWFAKDNDEVVYLHIGMDFESKLLRLTMIDFHLDGGQMEVSDFIGHTTAVGGSKYLNVRYVHPSSESSGYLFVKYQLENNQLGISLSENDVLTEAVKRGLLKGIVGEQKMFADVHITEDQDKLLKFVMANDKELFKEMHFLHRLIPPDLPMKQTP
jgi:hypothetical protein